MKLKTKIWALPVAAGAVFIIGCAVSLVVVSSASETIDHFRSRDYPAQVALGQVERSIETLRLTLQSAAAEGDESRLEEVAALEEAARQKIGVLAAIEGHAASARSLEESTRAFSSSGVSATRALIAESDDVADAIADMQKQLNALEERIKSASDATNATVERSQQMVARDVQRLLLVLLATCGAALLTLGVASKIIVTSVWRDLGDEPDSLRQAMIRVSNGDLRDAHTAIKHPGNSVRAVLAEMTKKLQSMVGTIHSATGSIALASNEIAAGNQDLSVRTETTAANLQRTASTVEELTATVRQTAESAQQAQRLATTAAHAAHQGGDIVAQVVTNMGEINVASSKINEITSVIDGIAFQTNILALNAAVEAARAGEQGRGFAVVASEVRSLAQRSAQAAREIKTLITNSTEKVHSGTQLVGQAGETMQAIVTGVQQVTHVIGEITIAAAEQSTGVGSVNRAVGEIDQLTQQNAALVEESAAAAASLREQAESLATTVAVFQIDSPASTGT